MAFPISELLHQELLYISSLIINRFQNDPPFQTAHSVSDKKIYVSFENNDQKLLFRHL